jgi:hypothetical protein
MTSVQSKGKYIYLNQMSIGIFWNFQIENRETYKMQRIVTRNTSQVNIISNKLTKDIDK